jgi:hypothetical protein
VNLRHVISVAIFGVCFSASLLGQSPQDFRLDAVEELELHNLKADVVSYLGRTAVRIANTETQDSGYGEGLAIVRGASLQDGTIEATVSGDTAADAPPKLRGFVGIAFRVKDRSHFECFYLRPKNGRSGDQLQRNQRNHSAQYMSVPGFPWDKLRNETPGKYESYVDLLPGQWTKLKIA